jgi:hypothetical protein
VAALAGIQAATYRSENSATGVREPQRKPHQPNASENETIRFRSKPHDASRLRLGLRLAFLTAQALDSTIPQMPFVFFSEVA